MTINDWYGSSLCITGPVKYMGEKLPSISLAELFYLLLFNLKENNGISQDQ